MKLQDITINNKEGEIHKVNGAIQYRSKSGKTIREYSSISELVKGEIHGKQAKKARKSKTKVVEATTTEVK